MKAGQPPISTRAQRQTKESRHTPTTTTLGSNALLGRFAPIKEDECFSAAESFKGVILTDVGV